MTEESKSNEMTDEEYEAFVVSIFQIAMVATDLMIRAEVVKSFLDRLEKDPRSKDANIVLVAKGLFAFQQAIAFALGNDAFKKAGA